MRIKDKFIDEIRAESINFDTYAKKEHRQQKLKLTDWQCRHLKELILVDHVDAETDESVAIRYCALCGAEMSDEMMKKREATLNKFKKIL